MVLPAGDSSRVTCVNVKVKKYRTQIRAGGPSGGQASVVAQLVKNPPAIQETWVGSLGWEDPLETGKATHSSILA